MEQMILIRFPDLRREKLASEAARLGVSVDDLLTARRTEAAFLDNNQPITYRELEEAYRLATDKLRGKEPELIEVSPKTMAAIRSSFEAQQRYVSGDYLQSRGLRFNNADMTVRRDMPDDLLGFS